MMNHADHDGLVASFYASAMNEKPWTETLHELAVRFGASASLLQVQSPQQQIIAHDNYGYSRDFSEAFFTSDAFNNDPRVPFFRNVPPGTIYYDDMLYDVDEMDRNPWVRESTSILGVKYQLGSFVALPDNTIVGYAILSTSDEGHATAQAIQAFRRLAPQIEQALNFGHMLEVQFATRSALIEALSQKSDGMILIGRTGLPSFMNDAACDILQSSDGLSYANGQFHAFRLPESRRLQSLIATAIAATKSSTDRPGGRALITRPSGQRPYILTVAAAPGTERFLSGHSIACVIHIQDLACIALPSRSALVQVFGLTERESDFAIELVRFASLEKAATTTHMAINTARNHLQSIFRKTNTATQSELVQLLGRLA